MSDPEFSKTFSVSVIEPFVFGDCSGCGPEAVLRESIIDPEFSTVFSVDVLDPFVLDDLWSGQGPERWRVPNERAYEAFPVCTLVSVSPVEEVVFQD